MFFRKKEKSVEPVYYDGGYGGGLCPFLVSPEDENGDFDTSGMFRCSKYNTELSYHDWVLMDEQCLRITLMKEVNNGLVYERFSPCSQTHN